MTVTAGLRTTGRLLAWLPILAAAAMSPAAAQTAGNLQAAREASNPILADRERTLASEIETDGSKPLAARGRRGTRLRSQNEIYNLARIADGRVGVRVGGDMSYRVEKRAGEP